jgi:hypothetical protein
MAQTLQNVVVCVTGNAAVDSTFVSPSPKCTINGVIGYPIVVKAYLSDQPIGADASAPSNGGNALNVTADIFVGAALVLCVALGWIAGGQR